MTPAPNGLFILLMFATSSVANYPSFQTVEGGSLFLKRTLPGDENSEIETHRAEFRSSKDCEHVAKILNEAEPGVTWFCSTSVPSVTLVCRISGAKIVNSNRLILDPNDSFEITLILNRGKARTAIPAIERMAENQSVDLSFIISQSFNYTESDRSYLLTNDYPYASGNYITQDFYLLIIDKRTGKLKVQDIGGAENGGGECQSVG